MASFEANQKKEFSHIHMKIRGMQEDIENLKKQHRCDNNSVKFDKSLANS